MSRLTTILAFAACIAVVVLLVRISTLEDRLARLERVPEAAPSAVPAAMEADGDLEVAVVMARMDRYHEKWWQAGKLGNAELSKFYLHELEEAMQEVADAHVVEEGTDVSAHMRTYGLSVVKQLATKLEQEGVSAMHADADVLVNTCNSCHTASGVPFIRVRTPHEAVSPGLEIRPL